MNHAVEAGAMLYFLCLLGHVWCEQGSVGGADPGVTRGHQRAPPPPSPAAHRILFTSALLLQFGANPPNMGTGFGAAPWWHQSTRAPEHRGH